MKFKKYIFISLLLIIISGCSNPAKNINSRVNKQMANISKIVLSTDFAFYHLNLTNFNPFEKNELENLSELFNNNISQCIFQRGYRVDTIYKSSYFYFEKFHPIKAKKDTITNESIYTRRNGRISERYKSYPQSVNRAYFYLENIDQHKEYSLIFPAIIDTNEKVMRAEDTLNQENLDVAFMFIINGIEFSNFRLGRKSEILALSAFMTYSPYNVNVNLSNSFVQIQIFIVDRKTNDIIYRNSVLIRDTAPSNTEDVIEALKELVYALPWKSRKFN